MKRTFLQQLPKFLIILTLLSASLTASIYKNNKSNVININQKNFDTQITHNRMKNVISFIHFYKKSDGKSVQLKDEIEKLSNDYDGMFKIGAIDCDDHSELCSKEEVKDFPFFKIYPSLPAPIFPYEGEIEAKAIITSLGRFVDNKAEEIHSGNVDSYVSENENLPKAFLFTDKKGVPLIYKVLALQFDKKIKFAIVRQTESSIVSKYKIKSFPTIIILPVGAKKPEFYTGENKFRPLFDFFNIFQETFFKVGEDKTKSSETTKQDRPWLNEKFPEMNLLSGNDLCFKVEGIICIVFISKGKPSEEMKTLSNDLQNFLVPKIDYSGGVKYKFSWIDSEKQSSFLKAVESERKEDLLLINPGKRKRFFLVNDEIGLESLKNVFDKLASGDLRFKMFAGNEFPELSE